MYGCLLRIEGPHTTQIHHQAFDTRKATRHTQRAHSPFNLLGQEIHFPSSGLLDLFAIVFGILRCPRRFGGQDTNVCRGHSKISTCDLEPQERGQDRVDGVLRDGPLDTSRVLGIIQRNTLAILIDRWEGSCGCRG